MLPDVLIIEPKVFGDERGFFFESFNECGFRELTDRGHVTFVHHSRSVKNTLRGLHYQIRQPQGKLVCVVAGEVFDVAVDRQASDNGLACDSRRRTKDSYRSRGFAQGFLALTEVAGVLYKTTDYWAPEYERSIGWNDPDIDIDWPIQGEPPKTGPGVQYI